MSTTGGFYQGGKKHEFTKIIKTSPTIKYERNIIIIWLQDKWIPLFPFPWWLCLLNGYFEAIYWPKTGLQLIYRKSCTQCSLNKGGTKLKPFSHVYFVKHMSGTYKYPSELLLFRNQQDSSVDISIDYFFHSETELKTSCYFLKQHRCLQ